MCRAGSAAVAITTTDLVSKSVAIESKVCEKLFLRSWCACVLLDVNHHNFTLSMYSTTVTFSFFSFVKLVYALILDHQLKEYSVLKEKGRNLKSIQNHCFNTNASYANFKKKGGALKSVRQLYYSFVISKH